MFKTFALANGLKVASFSLPDNYSVYLNLSLKCGSLNESTKDNGLAHFLEHILGEGIPSLPTAPQINSYIEDRAGWCRLTTSRQQINFRISISKENLGDAIRISKEMFFNPLFDQKAIEKEKNAVFQEIRSKMDKEFYKFWVFWKKYRFLNDTPLQLLTVGSLDSVRNFTREQLIEFWKKYFIVNNCCLTVVGGFDQSTLEEMVLAHFGELVPGQTTPIVSLSSDSLSNKQTVYEKRDDLSNNHLSFSWESISFDKDLRDEYTLDDIACRALVNMASSRLHRKLRSETGLVYGVSINRERYPGLGFTEIESRVSNENLPVVSKIIVDEVIDLYENGLSDEEFERILEYKINRSLINLDYPNSIADWIENEMFWYDKIEMPTDYVHRIKKIKKEAVSQHLKRYWNLNKANLLVQGPAHKSVGKALQDVMKVIS